jgi:hypothetical protein
MKKLLKLLARCFYPFVAYLKHRQNRLNAVSAIRNMQDRVKARKSLFNSNLKTP